MDTHRFYTTWLFLAALTLLGGVYGCRRLPPTEPQTVRRVAPDTLELSPSTLHNITVSSVTQQMIADRLPVMGRITPAEDRITVVPARVAGRIHAVSVTSGERVIRGQVLANLFSPDFSAAREEYRQALKQARAGPEAQTFAQSARHKLENMGLAPEDFAHLTDASSDQATYLTIRAPTQGVLLEKKAVVGNIINLGDTLFTIGDLSRVWFVGDIYPEDLHRVHKDQEIQVDPLDGGQMVYGKVSFISPVVDPTTRTIKIRALMDNHEALLRGDMYVQGSLILSRRPALVIPDTAVIHSQDAYFCFKRVAENRFQKVSVNRGDHQDGWVEVLKGLQAGDQIISEGTLLLDGVFTMSGA